MCVCVCYVILLLVFNVTIYNEKTKLEVYISSEVHLGSLLLIWS